MKVGTKSVLFGVHQFLWHPITVGLAWRKLYGSWPNRYEWIAIFCHDLGYIGKPDMDGIAGRTHPERGAELAYKLAYKVGCWSEPSVLQALFRATDTHSLSLFHSREYCKLHGQQPSKLYAADKFCCFFDPTWLYLLRSHLSGEIYEFRVNAMGHIPNEFTMRDWYRWYRLNVLWRPEIQSLLASRRRSCIFPF